MPVEMEGAIELRKALKQYAPDLSKETQKEVAKNLKAVVNRAKGFVPAESPLSGWSNAVGDWEYRAFNAATIKKGIGYSTTPTRPNKRGFRSLATIFNSSAAGAIYETAGRKNPQGQPPADLQYSVTQGKYVRNSDKKMNRSANPNAGRQFIGSMPPLVDSQQSNSAGRRTRKTKGRLMFRAWAEDQGRTTAAVVKAIESANNKVIVMTKGAGNKTFRARSKG